jgi:hypothetical protein
MVSIVPNGTNVKVEWYQRNYSKRSHYMVKPRLSRGGQIDDT